jgi:EAL domain-containing protein (putative c-di-GMP-specific phosphodiesterase class I)
VVEFEALARWSHPVHGDVPPDRFIPIAENCGLMRELSDWLLRCAV